MSDGLVSFGEFWDGILASEALVGLPAHVTLSPRTVVFGTAFLAFRKTLMANVFNRRIMLTFMVLIGGIFLHRIVANNLGHSFEELLNTDLVLMSVVAAVGALTITRQLFLLTATLGAGAICASLVPENALTIMVATMAITASTCGVLLFRISPPDDSAI